MRLGFQTDTRTGRGSHTILILLDDATLPHKLEEALCSHIWGQPADIYIRIPLVLEVKPLGLYLMFALSRRTLHMYKYEQVILSVECQLPS